MAAKAVLHGEGITHLEVGRFNFREYIPRQFYNHILVYLAVSLGGREFELERGSLFETEKVHLEILQSLSLAANKFKRPLGIGYFQYVSVRLGA